MPTMTMHTGYGDMPFTGYLIIRAKLRLYAGRYWDQQVKPKLPMWKRWFNVGRSFYVDTTAKMWLDEGNCPFVVVEPIRPGDRVLGWWAHIGIALPKWLRRGKPMKILTLSGLRLTQQPDGMFTDQYGRSLKHFVNASH